MDTYALMRLCKLLLGGIDDKAATFLALHVSLQPIHKEFMSIDFPRCYLLGIVGFPVLNPVSDTSLMTILGTS